MSTLILHLRLRTLRRDLNWLDKYEPARSEPTRLRVRQLEQRLGIIPTSDHIRRRVELRAKAGLYA